MSQALRFLLNGQEAMQDAIREHMAIAADRSVKHWRREEARLDAEAAVGLLAMILIRKAQATSREDL